MHSDQRITQDVERWCRELTDQVLMKIILSPFVIAYYSYKTYQRCVSLNTGGGGAA